MGDENLRSQTNVELAGSPLVRLGNLSDVPGVRSLESRYFFGNLREDQRQNGFVSIIQPTGWFEQVASEGGLQVAIDAQLGIVGFIVIAPPPPAGQPYASPIVERMMELTESVEYCGRPVGSYKLALRGPVCIDERFRGAGLYGQFNAATKITYSSRYDIGMLFVSARNPRSLRTTTTKLKATPLATFDVGSESYHFLVYDLGRTTNG